MNSLQDTHSRRASLKSGRRQLNQDKMKTAQKCWKLNINAEAYLLSKSSSFSLPTVFLDNWNRRFKNINSSTNFRDVNLFRNSE